MRLNCHGRSVTVLALVSCASTSAMAQAVTPFRYESQTQTPLFGDTSAAKVVSIAFSSEVEPGSREENASKQNLEPGSDSIRTDQALGELSYQMERLGIPVRGGAEAELSEYFNHGDVLGQNFCCQFLQSGIARDLDEMTHQDRADATSLPGIDDDKRHLGAPRLEDNVPAAPDDDLAAGFLCERDNCDMILEIDVHEESALLVREVALHCEEATLQRLGAGLSDRSEHISLILSPKRADVDLAAFAEELACSVADSLRHWVSCAGHKAAGAIEVGR